MNINLTCIQVHYTDFPKAAVIIASPGNGGTTPLGVYGKY